MELLVNYNSPINFEDGCAIYWSTRERVSYLQRRVLVYCCCYYELSESVILDNQYDALAKQLMLYKNECESDFKKSAYYYAFKTFTADTGYDLYSKLTKYDKVHTRAQANALIKIHKNYKQER